MADPKIPKMRDPVKCTNGMCPIPAGKFKMGSTNGAPHERPVREVELSEYHMMQHPVTVGQYKAYLAEKEGAMFRALIRGCGNRAQWEVVKNGATRKECAFILPKVDGEKVCGANIEFAILASMPGLREGFDGDDQPMVMVGWDVARAFCQFYGMDLPTEAQWERGARGLSGDKVYGTRSGTLNHAEAHYDASGLGTAPVCSKPENDLGLCDMAGNVAEWVADWYQEDAYESMAAKDPKGPVSGISKVLRGGSWVNIWPGHFRAADRFYYDPEDRTEVLGFRCVSAPQGSPPKGQRAGVGFYHWFIYR